VTDNATPIIRGTVGVHVLSAEFGESIVVTLPNEKWFLVDAYVERLRRPCGHPVKAFLGKFALDFRDCSSVLLTHMHQDHYSGILELITEEADVDFASHEVYRIAPFAEQFFEALEKKEEWELSGEKRRRGWSFMIPRAAIDIAALCRERERYYDVPQWRPIVTADVGEGCRVTAIGPPRRVSDTFISQALKIMYAVGEAGHRFPDKMIRASNALLNNMSIVLHIEFGQTRILLGADSQKAVWEQLQADPVPSGTAHTVGNVLRGVVLIKAPHHSSSEAWCPPLANSYREDSDRWAIATHHLHGGNQLPDPAGVKQMLSDGVRLLVPNKAFLIPEVRKFVDRRVTYTRIDVGYGLQGDPKALTRPRRALEGTTYPVGRGAPREIHWASLSFDKEGRVAGAGPYGGSQLAVLASA